MKIQHIYIVFILFSFFSCEDVIDVDVPESEPRLVIDASIDWYKGTAGNEQSIKLTLTAPFFNEGVPPANNAIVFITDQNNNTYNFIEDGNTGVYKNLNFIPVLNHDYELTVVYKNDTYKGTEKLLPVSELEYVEQNLEGGLTGENTEIKAFFTDPADEENYYFFEFIPSIPILPTLDTFKDEFVNGNLIFGFYVDEDIEPGDSITIRNHGVSERFYEFMFVLIQQTGEGGGPFETQPATVRGNCMNITNPDNYPLGYFRLSEVSELTYTIND